MLFVESGTIPDYSTRRRRDEEWEALGLVTEGHPLDYYVDRLQDRTIVPSTSLSRYIGHHVTLLGWMITERRLAVKQGSGVMKFVTLEDTCGTYEAVFFPDAYQTYGHLLTTHGPYLLTGRVQDESGAQTLLVEHVECSPSAKSWKWGAAER
jgi:DNA polymerase III alpha subunit